MIKLVSIEQRTKYDLLTPAKILAEFSETAEKATVDRGRKRVKIRVEWTIFKNWKFAII